MAPHTTNTFVMKSLRVHNVDGRGRREVEQARTKRGETRPVVTSSQSRATPRGSQISFSAPDARSSRRKPDKRCSVGGGAFRGIKFDSFLQNCPSRFNVPCLTRFFSSLTNLANNIAIRKRTSTSED